MARLQSPSLKIDEGTSPILEYAKVYAIFTYAYVSCNEGDFSVTH